ncbi:MAG: metal-dependent hydrolase [Chloroherpetonaceae bacterium]|nr:metal-dependent hydrolase [Chloroherpetonaceae bacterium]
MASYRGHLWGGIIFFVPFVLLLVFFFNFYRQPLPALLVQIVILLGITMLFALFPDIDIKSKGQRIFYLIFFCVNILLIATGHWREAAFLGLFAMLPLITEHRGWTHSFWAALVIPLPFLLLPIWFAKAGWKAGLPYYLAAVTGYLSHRFMDGIFFGRGKR